MNQDLRKWYLVFFMDTGFGMKQILLIQDSAVRRGKDVKNPPRFSVRHFHNTGNPSVFVRPLVSMRRPL
jgi:hypothetical protein